MTSPSSVEMDQRLTPPGSQPLTIDDATVNDVTTDSPTSYIRQGDSFICTLCSKVVTSKAAIVRHIQLTHEKRKPYQCNICHRRFGYKNILMEHQNVHYGIKPYACNLCDKRFAARSNLFQHRLLHRKPYSCEFCSKRFDRTDQLNRHMLSHPVRNMLSCTMCPFKTSGQHNLSQHIKESHSLQMFDTQRLQQSVDEGGGVAAGQNLGLGMLPNMDTTEALKTIDNICSQLASRPQQMEMTRQMHMALKQEPMSPSQQHQSAISRSGQFKNLSRNSLPASVSGGAGSNGTSVMSTSLFGQSSSMGDIHMDGEGNAAGSGNPLSYGGPVFPNMMSPSFSNNSNNSNSLSMSQNSDHNREIHASPSPSIGSGLLSETASPKRMSSPSASISRSCSAVDPTKSTAADSTSNLSEVICGLQSVLQKAQEIPEISIQVAKPRSGRDACTQHTSHIVGMPSLQDALSFYEAQGKLYRCPHCKILFEERGMFFLHKSLHGEMSPWECSICHKICSDKNDFNLHFVNEQHYMISPNWILPPSNRTYDIHIRN
ncbi:zinc finger protein 629-like [Gigantopelta aegis]|uniref:zinc finger protein 629-like n=1 Tax=Gigantopelta aegis TaxID=1735272 RepID=UPI001B88AD03|nr:zinc finger protein 629-like [Gigantopelta aegis]